MRVAIVNDLNLAVRALERVLAAVPGTSLAWTAGDGAQAVAQCAKDRPDLVLMDLVMPVMDGVEATRRIMRATPCPILIVTATVEGHLERVYNALGAGALDAVEGPVLAPDGTLNGAQPVVRKLRTLMRLGAAALPAPTAAPPSSVARPSPATASAPPLIVLGASTGGPEALATVLEGLSRGREIPVVAVQHLDAGFVPGLVEWLAARTGHRVRAIEEGMAPTPGEVLLACTNDHLVLGADRRLHYVTEPADLPYRPSADVFFGSLLTAWPAGGAAALLTGMGRDGAEGLLALRRAGWRTFAQDEATSVVYGMPRAARELGAAQEVLPLHLLGPALEAAWLRCASPTRPAGEPR